MTTHVKVPPRVVCLGALMLALGWRAAWSDGPSTQPADPAVLERGKRVYDEKCARCHGKAGQGDGPGAKVIKNKPRDFTMAVFKFRTTQSDGLPSDADLFRSLSDGFPAYGMQPFGDLPEEDRWAIVAHLKRLVAEGLESRLRRKAVEHGEAIDEAEIRRVVAEKTRPGTAVQVPQEPGGADAGAVERGRALFNDVKTFNCANCHGPEGHGDGPEAENLKDDWGFQVRPRDLTRQREFRKSGWRPEDTVARILTGIPGTPMPAHPKAADTEAGARQVWDIARFVESLSAPK